jgi:hypothetical protein
MNNDWSFSDAPNAYVFTTASILAGSPILRVTHDDGGDWQFHDEGNVTMADARVVSLKEAVSLDVSLLGLADLPRGWVANRDDASSPWVRMLSLRNE